MSYNGWENYVTWAVALWMDNDSGSYDYWTEQAQEAWDEAEESSYTTREENAIRDLADRMQAGHEDALPQLEGLWADLLRSAFDDVEWSEIAEHYLDEVDKTEEEEDKS